MAIEATINGEQISTIQVVLYSAMYAIPWLYGVLVLIGMFTDKVIVPVLSWAVRKMFVGGSK